MLIIEKVDSKFYGLFAFNLDADGVAGRRWSSVQNNESRKKNSPLR